MKRLLGGRLVGALLLALSGPLWVLGLALMPVYLAERLCTRGATAAYMNFRRACSTVQVANQLSPRDRYFAKSRNARRAHKAVRL